MVHGILKTSDLLVLHVSAKPKMSPHCLVKCLTSSPHQSYMIFCQNQSTLTNSWLLRSPETWMSDNPSHRSRWKLLSSASTHPFRLFANDLSPYRDGNGLQSIVSTKSWWMLCVLCYFIVFGVYTRGPVQSVNSQESQSKMRILKTN